MPGQSVRRSDFDQTFRKFAQTKQFKTFKTQFKTFKTKNICPDIVSDQNIKCLDMGHFCLENVRCPAIIFSSGFVPTWSLFAGPVTYKH